MRAYACVCVRMRAYACVCVRLRAYACECVRMLAHACACVRMRAYGCVCVRMRAYACIFQQKRIFFTPQKRIFFNPQKRIFFASLFRKASTIVRPRNDFVENLCKVLGFIDGNQEMYKDSFDFRERIFLQREKDFFLPIRNKFV